jgi:hypothetical protein
VHLAEVAGHDRAERGAQVDAHVEDRVGGIAADIGARVELPDDHRDVRLEEARADDDEGQRQPEHVDRRAVLAAAALDGHQHVAEGQQHRAEQYCLALAEVAVGEVAADHRRDVHQRRVGAVDDRGLAVGEQPVLHQVENQQPAHAVVGEALPHLGEEQHEQPARVAEEGRTLVGARRIDTHSLHAQRRPS